MPPSRQPKSHGTRTFNPLAVQVAQDRGPVPREHTSVAVDFTTSSPRASSSKLSSQIPHLSSAPSGPSGIDQDDQWEDLFGPSTPEEINEDTPPEELAQETFTFPQLVGPSF
jgi:hypothetical protein